MTAPHEGEWRTLQESENVTLGPFVVTAFVAILVACAGVGVSSLLLVHSAGTLHPAASRSAFASSWSVDSSPIEEAREGLALKQSQHTALREWKWLDRDAGVATIPIDRAIDIVVENARQAQDAAKATP